jgi:hypothetical protein
MLNLKLIVFLHAITAGSLQQNNCSITASEFRLGIRIPSVSGTDALFHSVTCKDRSEIPTGWWLVVDAATDLAGGTRSLWSINGMTERGKTYINLRKPTSVPICPPYIMEYCHVIQCDYRRVLELSRIIGLFDTTRDYTLQYTTTHSVHSHVFTVVAW